MALLQSELRAAATRSTIRRSAPATYGQITAFLCHSHKDSNLALGLQQKLQEQGLNLYIDWQDESMPEQPNRETADRLRRRIVDCTWFLFLATANSMASRWCPWEIGYADGKKTAGKIVLVPTYDGITTHGNEYLQLYPQIDLSKSGQLAKYEPNATQGTFAIFS
jgi:hypothetical protein